MIRSFISENNNPTKNKERLNVFQIYFGFMLDNNETVTRFNTNIKKTHFLKILTFLRKKISMKDSSFYIEKKYYNKNHIFCLQENKLTTYKIIDTHGLYIKNRPLYITHHFVQKDTNELFYSNQNYNHSEQNEVIRIPYKNIVLYFVHTLEDSNNRETYFFYIELKDKNHYDDSINDLNDIVYSKNLISC